MKYVVDAEIHYWREGSLPTVVIDQAEPPHGAKIEIHADAGEAPVLNRAKAQRAIDEAVGLAHRICAFLNSDAGSSS